MKHVHVIVLTLVSLWSGGCATLQEDGGRDFQATWPDVWTRCPARVPGE